MVPVCARAVSPGTPPPGGPAAGPDAPAPPEVRQVRPGRHDAGLDRVFQGQDASLALGLVSHVRVFLAHADHHALMSGAAHDRWEHGTGGVVTGETGLAHTGTIVYDQCGNFFVTHLD
jgi:hypothetical protein